MNLSDLDLDPRLGDFHDSSPLPRVIKEEDKGQIDDDYFGINLKPVEPKSIREDLGFSHREAQLATKNAFSES